MALLFHNSTTAEATLGSTAMHASSNVAISTGGSTSAGCTAPNTTNAVTGIVLYFSSKPSDDTTVTVELMESAVSKKTATMNGTDIRIGYNYVRFASAYTFATTSSDAYTVKVTGSLNSGNMVQATSGLWYELTYDSTSSPTTSDDVIIAGWQDAGMTTKTWTITGTSTSFGTGAIKNLGSSVTRTMQAALMIGNGGTVKFDDTADCTVEIKGAIYVTLDGVFDKRAHTTDVEIVSKLIINCDVANGDYGFHIPTNMGGTLRMDGKTKTRRAQYASGTGTAADPIVTSSAHSFEVNDEIIIPGLTYGGNQLRFVISIPNSTQLVVSSTLGGAETAITNTPAVGSWIGNLTSNSIVTAKTTTRGYYLYNSGTAGLSTFNHVRWEYASCTSGPNLQFIPSNTVDPCEMDGMVAYYNSVSGRISWNVGGTHEIEINDCIMLETLGSNYAGQSGLALQSASNKTINRLLHYAAPSSTANCGGLSFVSSSTNNTVNDSHFYGAGANNGSFAYAIGIITSHGNTFNDCTVNNSRVRAIYGTDGFENTFNNCNFGTIGSNLVDIFLATGSLATMVFNNCYFSSATRLSNVANCLTGTDIAFQDMDGNQSKHTWETPNAEFYSSGTGLTDTTTRTPGSLALAIKPRNSSTGGQLTFKIPANPASAVQIYGYIYRNATFSSGDITCSLYLPGTLLTDTPDDTVTLSTTTGTWQLWTLNAYNAGTIARYATVQITAKTATAGAYAFLDDIYDAQLNNKVAGMDLWDIGHISPVILALDLSAVPEQTRLAVWSDSNTYGAGEKGKVLADANDNAEAAAYEMYK